MRIVVTGREGQVARALRERGAVFGHEIICVGRPDFDLSGDRARIERALSAARPEAIVSAAAYTGVDKAEEERDLAFAINAVAPGVIANAARALGVPLVHLSTDYVFDGRSPAPYSECDPTGPLGVYGASKLAGETAVLNAHDDVAILRTAWVYSPFGSNFVKTMLRLATGCDDVRVVCDQIGNPTSAMDIADGLLVILSNLAKNVGTEQRGVFHMSGGGEASWAGFADAIFAASAAAGGPRAQVTAVSSEDYPTIVVRPANSRLDCRKLEAVHGVRLPDWRASLPRIVDRLVQQLNQDNWGYAR